MEPQILIQEIKLVGVQEILKGRVDLPQVPEYIYARLFARLDDIPDLSASNKTFGYWHFVDNETKLYFAGVQVDTLENVKWDYAYGLVPWSLGKTTWAIWQERDGEEGSIVHGNVCWDWLSKSEFKYDNRFIGDFEVCEWLELGGETRGDIHEIWIPVVEKES